MNDTELAFCLHLQSISINKQNGGLCLPLLDTVIYRTIKKRNFVQVLFCQKYIKYLTVNLTI